MPRGATGPNGANAWDSVVIKIREADQENASMPDAKFQFKTVTSTAKDTKSTWKTAAGLVQVRIPHRVQYHPPLDVGFVMFDFRMEQLGTVVELYENLRLGIQSPTSILHPRHCDGEM